MLWLVDVDGTCWSSDELSPTVLRLVAILSCDVVNQELNRLQTCLTTDIFCRCLITNKKSLCMHFHCALSLTLLHQCNMLYAKAQFPALHMQCKKCKVLCKHCACNARFYASNARSKTHLARETERSNLMQATSCDKFQPCHWPLLANVAFLCKTLRSIACEPCSTLILYSRLVAFSTSSLLPQRLPVSRVVLTTLHCTSAYCTSGWCCR